MIAINTSQTALDINQRITAPEKLWNSRNSFRIVTKTVTSNPPPRIPLFSVAVTEMVDVEHTPKEATERMLMIMATAMDPVITVQARYWSLYPRRTWTVPTTDPPGGE